MEPHPSRFLSCYSTKEHCRESRPKPKPPYDVDVLRRFVSPGRSWRRGGVAERRALLCTVRVVVGNAIAAASVPTGHISTVQVCVMDALPLVRKTRI
jgi:hypothetical protein